MEDDFSHLVPDEDEEIPQTFEDLDDPEPEQPGEVLDRLSTLSDIEPFEVLKVEVQKWLQGQSDEEALKQRWLALDSEMGVRQHHFQEGLRFQEWGEQLLVSGRQIFEQFEWIQDQMQRFDNSLEQHQGLEMAYSLEQIHASLVVLQQEYLRLRELQASLPQMSEFPLVAELIRVGQLAADQKIPMESFLERVHVYCDMQDRLHQAIEGARPAPRERAILEQEADRLGSAFKVQQQGVDELLHFAESLDRSALERGIEKLEEGAQIQAQIREKLNGAWEDRGKRACPFCSAENDQGNRFCARCSARLPDAEAAAQLENEATHLDEESAGLSSNFQRLAEAVQKRLQGQLDEESFRETLQWFRGIYQEVHRQRSNQKPPPANTPADQKALFEQAKECLESGLSLIGEGLEILESGEQLDEGLEQVIAGGDRLMEMDSYFQQAQQLTHALQER